MTFFFPVISQVGESSTEADLILCDTLRNITIFVHDVQICWACTKWVEYLLCWYDWVWVCGTCHCHQGGVCSRLAGSLWNFDTMSLLWSFGIGRNLSLSILCPDVYQACINFQSDNGTCCLKLDVISGIFTDHSNGFDSESWISRFLVLTLWNRCSTTCKTDCVWVHLGALYSHVEDD